MHELVLELTRRAPPGATLARLHLDQGALLACFERGQAAGTAPRWIAKIASHDEADGRLAAEARALKSMEPWAEELGVPRVVAWRPAEAPGHGCLIQTGLSGRHPQLALRRGRPWAALPEPLLACGAWLEKFQQRVPAPLSGTLAGLARDAIRQCEGDVARHTAEAPLLRRVHRLLAGSAEYAAGAAEALPMVAVHGDFWAGNLLRQRTGRLGVVDWPGFGAGSALQDLLTCLSWIEPARRFEGWMAAFFTAGSARDWLRARARTAGYSDSCARLAFFHFLQTRMRWELGLGLQHRDRGEVAAAERFWSEALDWLEERRYPDPFTPLPVA